MLIKLPIIINNKIDIINFKVIKKDNKIIVNALDYKKDDLFKIMISNKEFCLNNFNIKFPLEMKILDNKFLFSKFFFITTLTNGFSCELNFFSNLLNKINNMYQKKYSYINIDYLKNNITEIIKKTNIEIENRMTFEDFSDMELYMDNQLNYTLNLVYLLLYKFPEYTTKDFKKDSINEFIPKKILMCLNLVKNYSLKFKGSENISINDGLNHPLDKK